MGPDNGCRKCLLYLYLINFDNVIHFETFLITISIRSIIIYKLTHKFLEGVDIGAYNKM